MRGEKKFGIILKRELKAAGMPRKVLARRLGVTVQTVNAYVVGKCYPKVSVLIQIAEILDMSADRLLGIEETELDDPDLVRVCYCKDCRKHNKGVDDVRLYGDACPLVRYRGRVHGHEFDYQWCAYGSRKQ